MGGQIDPQILNCQTSEQYMDECTPCLIGLIIQLFKHNSLNLIFEINQWNKSNLTKTKVNNCDVEVHFYFNETIFHFNFLQHQNYNGTV